MSLFEKIRGAAEAHPVRCAALVLFVTIWAVYAPSLGYEPSPFDDSAYVGRSYLLTPTLQNWCYHWTHPVVNLHSPLVMHSYMLDYLFWGKDMLLVGCRVQNILLYFLAMFFFFLVLRELSAPGEGERIKLPDWAALFATLCAALHPQRVESVVWIAERKDMLVMFLGMAAVLTFIRAWKRGRTSIAAPLLFFSSFGAKPVLIALPLILLIGAWAAHGRWNTKLFLRRLWPLFFASFVYFLLYRGPVGGFAAASVASTPNRFPIALWNVSQYFWRTLFPCRLAPLHPLYSAARCSAVPGVLMIVSGVAIVALAVFPNRFRPLFRQGVLPLALGFGIAVAPMSGLREIGNFDFADRYSFYPSLFVWTAAAFALTMLMDRFYRCRRIIAAGMVLYLLLLGWMTVNYLPSWRNEKTLLEAALKETPPHQVALMLSSIQAFHERQYEDALGYAALLAPENQLDRDITRSFQTVMIGMVKIQQGEIDLGLAMLDSVLATKNWTLLRSAALNFAREVMDCAMTIHLARSKSDPRHIPLAAALLRMEAYVSDGLDETFALNYRANAFVLEGNLPEAEKLLVRAVKLSPDDDHLRFNLRSVREKLARQQEQAKEREKR